MPVFQSIGPHVQFPRDIVRQIEMDEYGLSKPLCSRLFEMIVGYKPLLWYIYYIT